MATFRKRADLFGHLLLMEAEGQIRSAFADHPEWVPDADVQWVIVRSVGKRIAGQFNARWERLSRVRRAVEQARAFDGEDGLAGTVVIPSRRLKRHLARASAPPKRRVVSALSKCQLHRASIPSVGLDCGSGRREAAEAAAYRRLIKHIGELAGTLHREAKAAATPTERVRASIRHGAMVDMLRMLAAKRT